MNSNGMDAQSLSLLRAQSALAQAPGKDFGAGEAGDKKRWQASLDFEAMFLGQMYKSMRQTVAHSEFTEPSFAREVFLEMFDKEMASANAHSPIVSGPAGLEAAASGQSQSLAAQIFRSLKGRLGMDAPIPNALPGKPLDASDLKPLVEEAAALHGLPANLLRSVIQTESANNPAALSPKGAKGLMQLMDSTATDMGVRNAWDPRENVMGGAKYLRMLLDRFGWDERLALAGYNAGPAAVDRHGGVPPYPETRDYVDRVQTRRSALDAEGP